MALADRFAAPPLVGVRGPECAVGRILRTLPADERAVLQRVLDDGAWKGTDITRALVAEGHSVAPQTLMRHRRGDCQCIRPT